MVGGRLDQRSGRSGCGKVQGSKVVVSDGRQSEEVVIGSSGGESRTRILWVCGWRFGSGWVKEVGILRPQFEVVKCCKRVEETCKGCCTSYWLCLHHGTW